MYMRVYAVTEISIKLRFRLRTLRPSQMATGNEQTDKLTNWARSKNVFASLQMAIDCKR